MKFIKYITWSLLLAFALLFVGGNIYSPKPSKERVEEALRYCHENGLSEKFAIFVDFGLPSGLPRYMIYDFVGQKVVYASLCATGLNKNQFSNAEGSHLSSLGKYRVTDGIHKMAIGRDGIILDGLESTNSNARKRKILIHYAKTFNYFPKSIFPLPIIGKNISWGCFSITDKGVQKTMKMDKPMLLWAYK